jgi:hypothetical protein
VSRTLLIECGPRAIDGTTVPVRLCWNVPGAAAFLGQHWHPTVITPPALEQRTGFDGERFADLPSPQVGDLEFALPQRLRFAAGLVWRDAPITIRQAPWRAGGANPADGDFTTIWQGLAEDITAEAGAARVRLLDGGQALRTAFAARKFGSSGIALLDAPGAAQDRPAGQVVPLAFGRCFSVPGLLVDRVNNIWLFSGRPATAVTGFYDGGAAFILGAARASLAALIANAPADGRVDWCLDADGLLLARPWDEPTYPFTCDAEFGSTLAGDIAAALAAGRLPMAAGTVAAFNAAVPAPCGLYVADDATPAALLDRLLAGLGTIWRVNSAGAVELRRLDFTAPTITIPAHRRSAPRRLAIVMPTARRSIGYARNNRVHSEGEIAQILLADDITYADGTPVQDLQPAEPGANATAANGANLVRFSRFERDAEGWQQRNNPAALAGSGDQFLTEAGRRVYRRQWTATAAGQVASIGTQFNAGYPVVGGQRISLRTLAQAAGAVASVTIFAQFRDANLAVVGTPAVITSTAMPRALTDGPIGGFLTVPAGAARVEFSVSVTSSAAGSMTAAIAEPMIAYAAPDQTTHPTFNPGPNASDGADVTGQNDPRLVLPAPVEITFQHTGALVVGQLPRTIQARRELGTTDVTGSTAWSITATGCTATIQTAGDANPGRITITAATGTGKIVVTAVRDGITLTGEVAVIRKDLPPPVTSGPNASALVNAALTTSSYGPVLAELFITLGAAGQAVLSAPLTISVSSGTGEQLARGKWMRETSPGTYADVGAEAISAPGAIGAPEPVEGSLSVSATVTGLTPSSNQRFRLFGRRSSGSNTMNFFGTASASGS